MAENKDYERELMKLENEIAQLKRDFEMYFAGAAKRPPLDSMKKVEQSVKKHGQAQKLSYAQRFRYNTILARFSSYMDLWSKQLKMKEEGRRMPGAHVPKVLPPQPGGVSRPMPQPPRSSYERIFDDYMTARQKTGEAAGSVDYQKFSQQLSDQKQALIQKYQCKDVEFYVAVENGKTKLKARAVR